MEKGSQMKISDWVIHVFIPWYTSLGITSRTVTLEVAGRKTGKPRRISLSKTVCSGQEYFVSLAGESVWVRNVRAAGGRAAILSGGRIPVCLVEVPEEERAPVMLAYVQRRAFTHSGAQAARHFFGLGPNLELAEMQAIAGKYIVMRVLTGEDCS